MMMDSGSRIFFNRSSSNMVFLGSSDPSFPGPKSVLNMGLDSPKKRPFFCSPDDYIDEEYYDEHLTEKKRRLTPEQVNMLEKSFEAENKLEPETKTQLAKKLGLQPRQVAVWFQNRRARWKTKQLERDYDLLKASYDSLLTDYESILGQHNKLKSEVASLTEKLQAKEVVAAKEPQSLQVDTANVYPLQLNTKAEDSRLSTGTAGSAVVDLDSPQLLDSGNSFFPNENDYDVRAINPEEDDGSDNGGAYFSDVFVAPGQQQHEVEDPLGWWMWS